MWIDLDGLSNLRDLGGTPAADGREVRPGRLLRSENLQDLTEADVARLREIGLTDVVDLRSAFEAERAPSPLADVPGIAYHQHSFFHEQGDDSLEERALPWIGYQLSVDHADPTVSSYLSFLADRPDSVVAALRAIAGARGAALVHCAAGKDRTGVTVALSLAIAGADDEHIVADYAATTQRIVDVVLRMARQSTYAETMAVDGWDEERLRRETPRPLTAREEVMAELLAQLRARAGGVEQALGSMGWTSDDSAAMRAHLLG